MLIDLWYVVVDVFGYKYYIHSCLSPSVWIWTKSTSMRGCWVASQYGPHSLVPLARLGHIEKQPSILACRLIFKNIPLGCPRGIFSHIHPSVDIQECISNNIIIHHSSIEIVLLTDCNILHIFIVTGHYFEIFIFWIIFLSEDNIYLK